MKYAITFAVKPAFSWFRRPRAATWLFFALFGFIAAVSAYDTYLSIKLQDVLLLAEENPLGRWLIQLDGGDVALFMTAKMIGTVIVLLALPTLYRYRQSWGMLSAAGVALFQGWLFYYLTFA